MAERHEKVEDGQPDEERGRASGNPPNIGGIRELIENRATRLSLLELSRDTVSNMEIKMVAYYMMAVMLFTNSQRPSAVQNITLTEYENRKQITEDGKTYTIHKVRSYEHLRV